MLNWFARKLKKVHEKDNEKGFTLIEILVVIVLHFHKQPRRPVPRPN